MGLNLQKTHLRHPERMMRVLLILYLAHLMAMFLGRMTIISGGGIWAESIWGRAVTFYVAIPALTNC